jgi:hypothetical protein
LGFKALSIEDYGPEDGSTSAATPPSGSLLPPKQRIDWPSWRPPPARFAIATTFLACSEPSSPRLVRVEAWSTLVHRTLEAKLADLLTDWSTEHQQTVVTALNEIADAIDRAALQLRTTQLSWRSV